MYVVMSRRKKIYARWICKILKVPVMHSFLLYYDRIWKSWWAIEIDNGGIRACPFDSIKQNFEYLEFYRSKKPIFHVLPEMINYVGKKYDYLGLLINIIRLCAYKLLNKIIWKKAYDDKNKLICTEFTALFLQKAKIQNAEDLVPLLTSPDILQSFLKNNEDMEQASDPTIK